MKIKDFSPAGLSTKDFALDLKDVGDDGSFTGYGSVFGNADSYGEIVEPGAFKTSLSQHAREKTMPLLLWQHDSWNPIGVWTEMVEDSKGLKCRGQLLAGVRQADEALILMKAGAVRGLSIGYRELAAEPDGNNRRLKKLDLQEVSIVSFPANRKAVIQSVKSLLESGELPTVRLFEELLRDAGFSKSRAAAIASSAAPHLRGEPAGVAKESAMDFLKALAG